MPLQSRSPHVLEEHQAKGIESIDRRGEGIREIVRHRLERRRVDLDILRHLQVEVVARVGSCGHHEEIVATGVGAFDPDLTAEGVFARREFQVGHHLGGEIGGVAFRPRNPREKGVGLEIGDDGRRLFRIHRQFLHPGITLKIDHLNGVTPVRIGTRHGLVLQQSAKLVPQSAVQLKNAAVQGHGERVPIGRRRRLKGLRRAHDKTGIPAAAGIARDTFGNLYQLGLARSHQTSQEPQGTGDAKNRHNNRIPSFLG